MKRVYMTMDEQQIERLDKACKKLGLTRSQFVSGLMKGRTDIRPPVLRYKEMIRQLAEIEKDLKAVALKDDLSDDDRILILTALSDIKDTFATMAAGKEDSNETDG